MSRGTGLREPVEYGLLVVPSHFIPASGARDASHVVEDGETHDVLCLHGGDQIMSHRMHALPVEAVGEQDSSHQRSLHLQVETVYAGTVLDEVTHNSEISHSRSPVQSRMTRCVNRAIKVDRGRRNGIRVYGVRRIQKHEVVE